MKIGDISRPFYLLQLMVMMSVDGWSLIGVRSERDIVAKLQN
jgi:hypothetical protein